MADVIDNLLSTVTLIKTINEESKKVEVVELPKEQAKNEKQNTTLKQVGAAGSALGNLLSGNYIMAGSMLLRLGSSLAQERLIKKQKEKTNVKRRKNY